MFTPREPLYKFSPYQNPYLPNNSVSRLEDKVTNSVSSTESLSETHRLTQLNGSRGAKEKNKENLNKECALPYCLMAKRKKGNTPTLLIKEK